jgi:hypothetical protein
MKNQRFFLKGPIPILVSLLLLFSNCEKEEECVTIREKKTLNNRYYFLFNNNNTNNYGNQNEPAFLPDNQASGEVSLSVYNAFRVGDRYCF